MVERRESAEIPPKVRWTALIGCASLCPFGDLLAVGGWGAISLLDSEGREIRTVEQDRRAWTRSMTEFDGRLAAGLEDGRVLLWNRDGSLSVALEGHSRPVISLAAVGDLLASASTDGKIKLWDRGGRCVRTLEEHSDGATSLAAFEGLLASGSGDETVKLWDVASGACVRILSGHAAWVSCLAAFAGHLVSGSSDGTLRWWTRGGECAKVLEGHSTTVWSLASSEELLFSVCCHEIAVWSAEGERLRTIASRYVPSITPVLCFWKGSLVAARAREVTMW
jgi:WD40 repeat protein